jgi:pyruvate formate-lyase activating enzyme-like uncharacterized protein
VARRSDLPILEKHTQSLSASCTQCAEGKKLVLFVTGVCDTGCFYCPLSDVRNHNPAMYANERLCLGKDPPALAAQVIEEAHAIGASGMGVTGGDPMLVPELTTEMVRRVKAEFGPKFDVHLYTSKAPPRPVLEGLARAGLNEIRFHPHESNWMRLPGSEFERAIRESREAGMRVGFEVPAIPGVEAGLRKLLDFAAALPVDYVNLNELEYTHTNGEELARRGLHVADDGSAAIVGSRALAVRLVAEYGAALPMHYCSSRFKDAVQLSNRVLRRADRTARPLDLVSKEGLIVVGIVESQDPAAVGNRLVEEFDVPQELIAVDPLRSRLEVAAWVLEEVAAHLKDKCFIVERYPTSEALEVERRPLN